MRVGDSVKFLSESMEGSIVRIDQRGLVYVETTDGFEIPCKASELVVIQSSKSIPAEIERVQSAAAASKEPAATTTSEKRDVLSKAEAEAKLLLGFVLSKPAQPSSSPVDCYLINDSNYDVLFVLGLKEGSHIRNLAHGLLEADTKDNLVSLSQTDINKASAIVVQAMFFTSGRYLPLSVIDEQADIRRFAFYKSREYSDNEYFDTPAIVFDIQRASFQEKLDELLQHDFSAKDNEPKQVPVKRESNPDEIDLHIESIVEDYEGLSEGEIIRIQLDRFHAAMQSALLHGQKKLVFIHGVGTGKLKHEIRKSLDNKYPDHRYQDASFREYGYGATMVFF